MSADRHQMSGQFARWITDAIRSRDLQASGLEEEEALLLPVWLWLVPRIEVGRKGLQDGHELLLPVRISFDGGTVVDAATQTVSWSVDGLGHRGQGVAPVKAGMVDLGNGFGRHRLIPVAEVGGAERLVESGKLAWWEMLAQFEKMIRVYIPRVHSAIRSELSDFAGWDVPLLLGATDTDVVVDRIILGEDGGSSRASRLIERCLDPHSFRRVDLVKYIATALRRDAEDEVRKQIGDPDRGRKIRLCAQRHGLSDPAAVVEVYNRCYPGEHMGVDRVQAALALAATPSASWSAVEKV